MPLHFAAYLGIAALVILSPGQDTALTIRNSLLGGRRGGMATGLGVVAGQAVWLIASGAGLVALLRASSVAFTALRVAGAAYLLWLGAHALYAAARRRPAPLEARTEGGLRSRAAFRQGLLSNAGNPKMAVFFTSLLPQFLPAGGPVLLPLLVLGLTFSGMTLLWLSFYAAAVQQLSALLLRGRVRRTLDAVTGTVLVATGLRLATQRD